MTKKARAADHNLTTTGRNVTHNWTNGPSLLRQRTLGRNKVQRMQLSHDFIRELKLEARLINRHGEPENLEWNQRGDLLAHSLNPYSLIDTGKVIVWDVFRRQAKCHLETGHINEYISSLKFMPASSDTQIVTSGDDVRLTDLSTNQNSCLFKGSRRRDISQLVVHPSEPNLVWFSRCGHIIQYDIRQARKTHDLYFVNERSRCDPYLNCMAINPLHSEMLAVGSRDYRTRLFDRRAIRSDTACIAQFMPRHIVEEPHCLNEDKITSLAFNHDGSELLASYWRNQIYLFKTYEPWEKFRLFDPTESKSSPLIFDRARNDLVKEDTHINGKLYDFSRQYCGYEGRYCRGLVTFFGKQDEFIVSSCWDGFLCIWDKSTTNITRVFEGDYFNAAPHPSICMLASTSLGHENVSKNRVIELWSTIGGANMALNVEDEVLAT